MGRSVCGAAVCAAAPRAVHRPAWPVIYQGTLNVDTLFVCLSDACMQNEKAREEKQETTQQVIQSLHCFLFFECVAELLLCCHTGGVGHATYSIAQSMGRAARRDKGRGTCIDRCRAADCKDKQGAIRLPGAAAAGNVRRHIGETSLDFYFNGFLFSIHGTLPHDGAVDPLAAVPRYLRVRRSVVDCAAAI